MLPGTFELTIHGESGTFDKTGTTELMVECPTECDGGWGLSYQWRGESCAECGAMEVDFWAESGDTRCIGEVVHCAITDPGISIPSASEFDLTITETGGTPSKVTISFDPDGCVEEEGICIPSWKNEFCTGLFTVEGQLTADGPGQVIEGFLFDITNLGGC